MDQLGEQLYNAVTALLHDNKVAVLLPAVGEAKMGVPYDKAAPKTRILFATLAENLTRVQAKG